MWENMWRCWTKPSTELFRPWGPVPQHRTLSLTLPLSLVSLLCHSALLFNLLCWLIFFSSLPHALIYLLIYHLCLWSSPVSSRFLSLASLCPLNYRWSFSAAKSLCTWMSHRHLKGYWAWTEPLSMLPPTLLLPWFSSSWKCCSGPKFPLPPHSKQKQILSALAEADGFPGTCHHHPSVGHHLVHVVPLNQPPRCPPSFFLCSSQSIDFIATKEIFLRWEKESMLTRLPDSLWPAPLPLTSVRTILPVTWIPALLACSLPLQQPSRFHRGASGPLLPGHRRLSLPRLGLLRTHPQCCLRLHGPFSGHPGSAPPPQHYFISSAKNYLNIVYMFISQAPTPIITIRSLVCDWILSTCVLSGSNGSTY